MSKFITEIVTIKNRELINRIASREERVTLEIELVSSGDTTIISSEDIISQVFEKLKYITKK